ncbi:MAG: protein kinase [Kofleriaceae bacterium]
MGADLAAEEQFGPYLVYERLGVGGMATVHRALERGIEGFERIVALKRLLPHLAEDASFIKSFVREAKLASLLHHNNVVQIFELGRVGTEYFISMEYIDGRDIRRILRHARKVTGPPPIHVTTGLLLQLCDALDYAHSKVDDTGHPLGLVHRDVSPSNLLVTLAGHLKVIDFGIAKAQSSQLRTQTGRVKGKLAYMAPEAVTGKELDARSDLFAAGVIAHELLTARPLFASKNEYQTLLKVQRGDIMPPSTFNQGCPPELDAITLRALARDPDDRFNDAAELRDELLAMRRKYNLQTGHRDVAQWLDWAFALEPPSGGFAAQNTFDQSGSPGSGAFDLAAAARSMAPRPRSDEDAAVEIAWGGGEVEANSGAPILLDDVPDVSEKHLARSEHAHDHGDDIPASEPSHGQPERPVRDTAPSGVPAAIAAPEHSRPASRSTPPPIPARTSAIQAAVMPPMRESARRITASGIGGRAGTESERQSGLIPPAMHARAPSDLAPGIETPGTQPAIAIPPEAVIPRVPTTKPGVAPMPVRPAEPVAVEIDIDVDDAVPTVPNPPRRASRTSSVSIGANIITRQSVKPNRAWQLILLLVLLGGAATAVTLYLTRGQDTVPVIGEPAMKVPSKTSGTVKFVIEPDDVEISIEGQTHVGSPWSVQLEPGIHSIQIHRDGYKARLTSIELSPNETTTMIISLVRLGTQIADADANLILNSTPQGLEVVIDGRLQPQRTPYKAPISVGPHSVALRQNGIEVWRQQLVALANVDHEFSPSMAEEKLRERKQRIPAPVPAQIAKPDAVPEVTEPVEEPKVPDAGVAVITPPVLPPPPAPTPTPIPTPPPPPVKPVIIPSTGPVTVAPSAVTRIAGESPTLGMSKKAEIPPVITAKVCIDPGGAVTSVDLITKLERHTASDLASTMRGWRYAPYKQGKAAVAACFAVSFRVK